MTFYVLETSREEFNWKACLKGIVQNHRAVTVLRLEVADQREGICFSEWFSFFRVLACVRHCDSWKIKNPTRCHLLLLFFFLETQHVSGINMPIFRSLRLCCWTTTLAVTFLVGCVLELGCGSARLVSGLWQHVILCKSYATDSVPGYVCRVLCNLRLKLHITRHTHTHTVRRTLSGVRLTQYDMLPQH